MLECGDCPDCVRSEPIWPGELHHSIIRIARAYPSNWQVLIWRLFSVPSKKISSPHFRNRLVRRNTRNPVPTSSYQDIVSVAQKERTSRLELRGSGEAPEERRKPGATGLSDGRPIGFYLKRVFTRRFPVASRNNFPAFSGSQ